MSFLGLLENEEPEGKQRGVISALFPDGLREKAWDVIKTYIYSIGKKDGMSFTKNKFIPISEACAALKKNEDIFREIATIAKRLKVRDGKPHNVLWSLATSAGSKNGCVIRTETFKNKVKKMFLVDKTAIES